MPGCDFAERPRRCFMIFTKAARRLYQIIHCPTQATCSEVHSSELPNAPLTRPCRLILRLLASSSPLSYHVRSPLCHHLSTLSTHKPNPIRRRRPFTYTSTLLTRLLLHIRRNGSPPALGLLRGNAPA